MTNRTTRGFSRLGIGAAILVALAGVVVTGIVAVDQYGRWKSDPEAGNPPPQGFAIDHRLLSDVDVGLIPLPFDQKKSGNFKVGDVWWHHDPTTGNWLLSMWENLPSPVAIAAKAAGMGLGITALAALAAFGFFRGLGWIIAGFGRD
jgi:hypothetical protein